ncbi:MAG: PH domain-containing protein [Halobacteriota archaeon]
MVSDRSDSTVSTDTVVPAGGGDLDPQTDLQWLQLEENETIRWASTAHKSSLVAPFAIGIPLSFVLVGIPILVAAYLDFVNTNYVVTTRGLYRKSGIVSRDVQQIGFEKVQNTSYSQSAIGAYFGYGTVDVSTAGSSGVELRFRSVPEPARLQELITRETDRRRDRGEERSETEPADVLDEILAELRAIRRALEASDNPIDENGDSIEKSDNPIDESVDSTAADADDGDRTAAQSEATRRDSND